MLRTEEELFAVGRIGPVVTFLPELTERRVKKTKVDEQSAAGKVQDLPRKPLHLLKLILRYSQSRACLHLKVHAEVVPEIDSVGVSLLCQESSFLRVLSALHSHLLPLPAVTEIISVFQPSSNQKHFTFAVF